MAEVGTAEMVVAELVPVVAEANVVGVEDMVEIVEPSEVEGVRSDSATERKIFIVLREVWWACIVGFCLRNL